MGYINDLTAQLYEALGEYAPADRERYDSLMRTYAVLTLAKGLHTTLEDVHDAWSAWCEVDMPEHHSLVPFKRLAPETQALDQPYLDAIYHVRRSLNVQEQIQAAKREIVDRLENALDLMDRDPGIKRRVLADLERDGTAERLRQALAKA